MNLYRVTLKHDAGKKRMQVYASNKVVLKEIVCKVECCPECAIVEIKKLKSIHG